MFLTRKELQQVHALQIWPRAPWSQLAPVLDADPVTLARRWASMGDRGLAWITCQPQQRAFRHGAIVEVECDSGSINSVVAELSRDPDCMSIDVVSGGRDLVLSVGCAGETQLNRYLLSRLGEMPGVRSVRTNPVITLIAGATQWRVNALSAEQVAGIEVARQKADPWPETRASARHEDLRAMIGILCRDGRATSASISRILDISPRRAREQLHATMGAGLVDLRTDIPRRASDWPVGAWYFLRVPAADLPEVGARLRALRTVKAVLSVAGPANILVHVWLREISEVEGLEVAMEQALSSVRIIDRSLVLAVRKRVGRVFDEDEVPCDVVPWELGLRDLPTRRSES